jgi:FtsZ-binding cell division protein ZapB
MRQEEQTAKIYEDGDKGVQTINGADVAVTETDPEEQRLKNEEAYLAAREQEFEQARAEYSRSPSLENKSALYHAESEVRYLQLYAKTKKLELEQRRKSKEYNHAQHAFEQISPENERLTLEQNAFDESISAFCERIARIEGQWEATRLRLIAQIAQGEAAGDTSYARNKQEQYDKSTLLTQEKIEDDKKEIRIVSEEGARRKAERSKTREIFSGYGFTAYWWWDANSGLGGHNVLRIHSIYSGSVGHVDLYEGGGRAFLEYLEEAIRPKRWKRFLKRVKKTFHEIGARVRSLINKGNSDGNKNAVDEAAISVRA